MMMVRALRVLCLLLSLTAGQAAADAPAKKYELVTDHLPSVEELLQTLEMESLLDTFYNSGFTETFYVLRCEAQPRATTAHPCPHTTAPYRRTQTPPHPTAAPKRRRRRRLVG